MKNIAAILFVLICLICLHACRYQKRMDDEYVCKDDGRRCKLTLTIDSSFFFDQAHPGEFRRGFEYISLMRFNYVYQRHYLDSGAGLGMRYKELLPCHYRLTVTDIFGDSKEHTIALNKDTTVFVRNEFQYDETDSISEAELLAADKVVLRYKLDGCFADYYVLNMIEKTPRGYTVHNSTDQRFSNKTTEDIEVKTNADVIHDVYRVMMSTRRINREIKALQQKGTYLSSTNREQISIKAGKHIYLFDDRGISPYYHASNDKVAIMSVNSMNQDTIFGYSDFEEKYGLKR